MSKKDSLGDRMKGYEHVFKQALIRRTPVIIRVDGKAFHTFTRQINSVNDPSSSYGPSEKMHSVMMNTAYGMLAGMQNGIFAYTQSDEISFLLKDWTKIETEQWFKGDVQKISSVAASMATALFNVGWHKHFVEPYSPALFDARVFNIPIKEVNNYFIWRQQDATRNSIQFIARKHFSHKQLIGKNNNEIQEMLWKEFDCNWNDYLPWKKRGAAIIRYQSDSNETKPTLQMVEDMPILTEAPSFIGRFLE